MKSANIKRAAASILAGLLAEELAMKSCLATRAHYKVTNGGACEIAASK